MPGSERSPILMTVREAIANYFSDESVVSNIAKQYSKFVFIQQGE